MENKKINLGFWKNLAEEKKPFFCLAPMADVTDAAFRQIIAKYSKHGQKGGGPDVFWTEFVSADGLVSVGGKALMLNLQYNKKEKPIVAQIFGSKEVNMTRATQMIKKLGFDGIDINMGCPDRDIEKQQSGACHMKDSEKARKIIRAVKEGAGDLPVSVKTRIGYNKNEIETWIPEILKENVAVLTVHLRTRKEMSVALAHWDQMKKIVELRDKISPETLIIGNGDVKDLEDGKQKAKETGCDGIMIGRAVFGNPWVFAEASILKPITINKKLETMVEHAELYEKIFKGKRNFASMRKHYKAYANGFDGAKELRVKLMTTKNAKETRKIVENFLKK
ncbi:MAG: tRNA-dihydrouridine synthase [Candidatus Paceibacterota bacterium]|jgi:nifR3 family TIM-barrel protein